MPVVSAALLRLPCTESIPKPLNPFCYSTQKGSGTFWNCLGQFLASWIFRTDFSPHLRELCVLDISPLLPNN